MIRFLILVLAAAFAAVEAHGGKQVQPSFGKKKADKAYVVPKQVIRDSSENVLKFLIVEDGVVPNTHCDASGIPASPPLQFGDVFRILDTDLETNTFFLCNETLQELNKIQYKLWLLQDLQNKQLREFVKEKDQDAKPGVVPETVYKWRVKAGSTSTPASRFFKFRATEAKTLSYIWLDLEDELP